MLEVFEIIKREAIFLWYYSSIQFYQIFPYYAMGIFVGSLVSVFGKDKIHALFTKLCTSKIGVVALIPASILGILSPLCMYGTIPIAASFSEKGIRDDLLAAFMVSSILLNPQLLMYTTMLGGELTLVRLITCFLCGIFAGVLVRIFFTNNNFFNFSNFGNVSNKDIDPNPFLRFLKNLWRNILATAKYFIVGILLTSAFTRYVPVSLVEMLFGANRGFGVLFAATIGVPLYMCGGGTIPLLSEWLYRGMSFGSATSFMITGPATKITNLSALKMVLGGKHFALYFAYIFIFSLIAGLIVNVVLY